MSQFCLDAYLSWALMFGGTVPQPPDDIPMVTVKSQFSGICYRDRGRCESGVMATDAAFDFMHVPYHATCESQPPTKNRK